MLRLPVSRALSQSSRSSVSCLRSVFLFRSFLFQPHLEPHPPGALSTLSSKECIALEEKHGAHKWVEIP